MNNTVLRERRLSNGLVIQMQRQSGMLRRVCVVLDEPLEDYSGIGSKLEAECLMQNLSEKYDTISKEDLMLFQ